MVCFRQHDDRHVSHKIKLMRWNTLMDLIAIGMKNGDVSIHRLVNWQKIWTLTWPNSSSSATTSNASTSAPGPSASSSGVTTSTDGNQSISGKSKKDENGSIKLDINAMEWRPDGKVLAVGYNRNVKHIGTKEEKEVNGSEESSIALVDIENGQVITILNITGSLVNCMCWQAKNNFILNDQYKLSEEGIEDILKVASQTNLNLMAVGTTLGTIHIYIFGIFLVGVFNLQDQLPISHVSFSADLGSMMIIIGTDNVDHASKLDNYQYRSFKLPFFKNHSEQYFIVSHIYAKIMSLLSYLEDIIGSIQETMEDILLELDSKLTSYLQPKGSNENASGSSSSNSSVLRADEILDLLVIGALSDSFEKFLHQLTDKGLKKLGQSIESTYSSVQKLVVCNVQRACKHIFSHLNVLKAISMWTNEFSQLGFKTSDINRAIHGVATFYLKALELQQVIDSSCQNLKCFFRWLYSVTVRICNDSMPSSQQESIKVSQQDLQYVADFIEENFDWRDESREESAADPSYSPPLNRPTATNFTLERVCQYLKAEPLVYRTFSINDQSLNPWFKYLKERPMLIKDEPTSDLILFKHNAETSLITEHTTLIGKTHDAFKNPSFRLEEVFTGDYEHFLAFNLSFPAKEAPKVTSVSDEANRCCYIAIASNSEGEGDVSMIKFAFHDPYRVKFVMFTVVIVEPGTERETIPIDIQFYSESILSMLLVTKDSQYSFLLQLPLSTIEKNFLHLLPGCSLQQLRRDHPNFRVIVDSSSDISIRRLENFKPSQFSVSGSRKVCCVSSRAKRRVRVFEMDGNEEEAEEAEEESGNFD
ncbi:anaphase-promoting complex subunit 4-like [Panonychus citri]|uniref:anaphase-promoting complex subunit 4-like n=1 Tax=Panonychus citri TaxID=50023 RepID=UPI0023081572|nr:anaphase-promoting complex subunit 4-like [Panonychus citri]